MRSTLALLLVAALAGGCAATGPISSTVVSYSQWHAERRPGPYVFERLPSQQLQGDPQRLLEDAARGPLAAKGFVAATSDAAALYSVLLTARLTGSRGYYDDPWPGGGRGYGRISSGFGGFGYGSGVGLGVGFGMSTPLYEREVTVLIRDRQSGQTLYETRAVHDGLSPLINAFLPAMVDAALKDFPHAAGPRRVTSALPPAP